MSAMLLVLRIFTMLPNIIIAIEKVAGAGNGSEKLAAVLAQVTPLIPDSLAPKVLPMVKGYINDLVARYNTMHPAFQAQQASESTLPPGVSTAIDVGSALATGLTEAKMPSFGA